MNNLRRMMSILLTVAVAAVLSPGATSAAPGPAIVNDYQFSSGFSNVQGDSQWFYQQWNGTAYSAMGWDASLNGWRGSCSFCIIVRDWIHPDSSDAVIVWKAPRSGSIAIRGVMDHGDYTKPGDGVRTTIRKQSGTTASQIWPSAGVQVIRPGFSAQHILKTDVQTGDLIQFHVNQAATSSYDTLSWDPRISYDYEPQFTVDQTEAVMTPADFDRVGITVAHDAPLSMVPNGTNMDFYHSGGESIQKFRGSLAQPAQTSVYAENRFTNPRNLPGKWWITNLHQTPEGHLLGFCHVEYADPATTGWWVLGLAYSTDGGNTFQKLGFTIGQEVKDTGHNVNIGGTPYVVKDGYFYAYFDEQAEHVARAKVSDVLAAARTGEVTPWQKYFNGAWNEPGMHGRASPILPQTADHSYLTHGDAAYSTYLGKYLLTSYNHGAGKGVYLATSDDGVSFPTPSWLQTNRWDRDSLSPYQSIVNIDGTDNGVVGQSFYVYSGYRNKQSGVSENEWKEMYRWIYRQKVTLNRAGYDRNTTDASTDFTNKQNQNGWGYLEYSPTSGYANMRWDSQQYRWNGSAGNLMANSFTQHPDAGKDSVRSWTAPRGGTVRISAAMGGIRLGAGPNADGVGVRIARQHFAVWPPTGYRLISPGEVHEFQPIDVTVSKGDTLFFHVNQNASIAYDTVTWAPLVSYVDASRITYQAWADFAGVQGHEGWTYHEHDGSRYIPMTWNSAAITWEGSFAYLLVRPTVQHPAGGQDSVRAWTAPRAGVITLTSALGDIKVAGGSGADGVRVKVMHNGGNLWPATGYQSIVAGGGVAFAATTLTVSLGDTLYFHVNQNGDTGYDTVTWVPAIAYAG